MTAIYILHDKIMLCIKLCRTSSLYQRQKDAEVRVTQPSELAKYIQEL